MDHDRYGSAAYGASAGPASGDVYMADATRGADHAGPEADRYRSARHNRPENDDERSQRRSGRREYERDDRRRDYDRERDYSYDREHGYDRERDHDRRRSGRRDEGGYGGSHHHRNSRDDGHYESPARPQRRGYDDHYDDDHRGGASRGGGGGRGRGGPDWRNADAREPSPTIKRSPTPEGTIPLSQRQRRNSKWDLAPDGFEGIGALQAKASGIFGRGAAKALSAVPHMGQDGGGHGGLPPIHIGGNGSGMGLPGGQIGAQASLAVNPNVNRQARRLYVGNITYEANEAIIASFFNHRMREIGHAPPGEGDPCVGAQINPDKGYAFVEFRSPEEATIAMGFDGIVFQNQSLKIRRPKDYQGPDIAPPRAVHVPGVISTNVPDSPNKIFIGGLPTYIADEQVIELLKAFGELRAFNLVKEAGSGASKGFAFCEYVDPAITDIACQGLNDIELGGRRLVVQRASVGANRTGPTGSNIGPLGPGGIIPPSFTADGGQAGEPTPCMQMLNMVTPQELIDDEEYTEIVEDVRDECAKFGTVLDVRIPRPMAESKGAAGNTWRVTQTAKTGDNEDSKVEREGVGRVYVKFAAVDECAVALQQIAGRQFGGRVVICAFLREEEWPADEDGGENADATTGQMNDGVGAAAGQAAAAGLADASAAEEGAPKAENAEPVKAEEDQ
ncbi:unnamed protein product [Tilletia laevis]|uniref:RRM domain-containing protein n=3 Tax=Tilletia TaxID=13289 RepID=A0A9N8LBG2_9BASI|nr:hypothetical protein CF336_g4211 [Tilletia laevis]CAD6897190.1 unnamed protein product [Tilletia caries]CAD6912106.1 unnamed protein product [Tilletia controversa]KAE8199121.1 hypothetical protein CF335_g4239 [Tilletia laevis]CAD6908633.1 unnamed protein product [Tilletia laevis]